MFSDCQCELIKVTEQLQMNYQMYLFSSNKSFWTKAALEWLWQRIGSGCPTKQKTPVCMSNCSGARHWATHTSPDVFISVWMSQMSAVDGKTVYYGVMYECGGSAEGPRLISQCKIAIKLFQSKSHLNEVWTLKYILFSLILSPGWFDEKWSHVRMSAGACIYIEGWHDSL